MSNLPIVPSAPQNAAKAASQSSATAAADDAAPQGQPFGDVLARQVSDAGEEAAPVAKKAGPKSAEEIFADIKAAETTPAAAPDPAAGLPNDMLAALMPQAANTATQPKADVKPDELTASSSAAASLPGLAALTSGKTGPSQAKAAEGTSAVSTETSDAASGLAAAKDNIKATPANLKESLVEGKKDAAFTSILAAAGADKLAKHDSKDQALPLAPATQQPNAANLASLQNTANSLAPAVVMPTVVTIDTPVNHDKWGDEFNQKITWLASSKEQSAELHLNPPQLGPMDVVLKVSGDQATALFTSPHAAVRDAIEQALPKLREMMADSGIMLGNATVSDNSRNSQQGESGNKSGNSRSGITGVSDTGAASAHIARVSQISRHNGIVDTFA